MKKELSMQINDIKRNRGTIFILLEGAYYSHVTTTTTKNP